MVTAFPLSWDRGGLTRGSGRLTVPGLLALFEVSGYLAAGQVPGARAAGQQDGDGDGREQRSPGGVEEPGVDAVDERRACAGLDGPTRVDGQGERAAGLVG